MTTPTPTLEEAAEDAADWLAVAASNETAEAEDIVLRLRKALAVSRETDPLAEVREAWNTPPRSDESNEDWEARRDTMMNTLLGAARGDAPTPEPAPTLHFTGTYPQRAVHLPVYGDAPTPEPLREVIRPLISFALAGPTNEAAREARDRWVERAHAALAATESTDTEPKP